MKKKASIKNTSHNSNKIGNLAKIVDMYSDIFTLREKPVKRELIERIFNEALQDVVNDPTILKASHYFRKKGIPLRTIERWCDTYPWAQDKYNEVKQAIGDNREIGALNKKLDSSLVISSMPKYDKEWKELVEWRESLKKSDTSRGSGDIIKVIMENFGFRKDDTNE